ncbi:ATP-binding protein [Sanguibacter sp. A247]|uniref:ATP-binding protein n=1 Tax=unclassified Sanguibacter TaxID=2645534 RepID=UPI003FD6D571
MKHALAIAHGFDAIAPARRWAAGHLKEAGVDGHLLDILVLLVSEVVTNAVAHATPPVLMHLEVSNTVARVEVTDQAREVPVIRRPAPTQGGGRGVGLVDQLATRWGVVSSDDNGYLKTVWFEVALRTV